MGAKGVGRGGEGSGSQVGRGGGSWGEGGGGRWGCRVVVVVVGCRVSDGEEEADKVGHCGGRDHDLRGGELRGELVGGGVVEVDDAVVLDVVEGLLLLVRREEVEQRVVGLRVVEGFEHRRRASRRCHGVAEAVGVVLVQEGVARCAVRHDVAVSDVGDHDWVGPEVDRGGGLEWGA